MPRHKGVREWPPGSPKARRRNGARRPWRPIATGRDGENAPATEIGADDPPLYVSPLPEPTPEFPVYDSLPFTEVEAAAEPAARRRRRWFPRRRRRREASAPLEHPEAKPVAEVSAPEAAAEAVEPLAPEPAAEPLASESLTPEPLAPEPPSESLAPEPAAASAEAAERLAPESLAPEPPDEPPTPEPTAEAADVHPLGPRRARGELRERERRRRRWGAQVAVLIVAIVATIVVGVLAATDRPGTPTEGTFGSAAAGNARSEATLVAGTSSGQVVWMSLLYSDPAQDRGAVVYVPAHIAAEVPGRGLLALGDSYDTGDADLLETSTSNLLGVPIAGTTVLDEDAAAALFAEIGSVRVDVPLEVRVPAGPGEERVAFSPGRQTLEPGDAVALLYTRGIDVDDVDLGARHLAFWDGLFARFGSDPGRLRGAVRDAFERSGVPGADAARAAGVLAGLAAMGDADRPLSILPVRQVSVGRDELYATNAGEIEDFLATTLGTGSATDDLVRVQILNGVGVPGVGREVAEKLVGRGFQVVLSGNARRFDYEQTLIIGYGGPRPAQRTKALLGVGKVLGSAQQQGIVDVTVVIGKDFLRTL